MVVASIVVGVLSVCVLIVMGCLWAATSLPSLDHREAVASVAGGLGVTATLACVAVELARAVNGDGDYSSWWASCDYPPCDPWWFSYVMLWVGAIVGGVAVTVFVGWLITAIAMMRHAGRMLATEGLLDLLSSIDRKIETGDLRSRLASIDEKLGPDGIAPEARALVGALDVVGRDVNRLSDMLSVHSAEADAGHADTSAAAAGLGARGDGRSVVVTVLPVRRAGGRLEVLVPPPEMGLVAATLSGDEDVEATAMLTLAQEMGMEAEAFEQLTLTQACVGMIDAEVHVLVAREARQVPGQVRDDRGTWHGVDEAIDALMSRSPVDMSALLAVFLVRALNGR